MSCEVETWGRFDDARREFVLWTPKAPRAWKNILWNERFNSQPTQLGGGVAYRRDEDGVTNLLHWTGSRVIYVVDRGSGEVFCPGYWPVCNDAMQDYECRYGLGYHIIRQTCSGVSVTVTSFVPTDDDCEVTRIELRDLSGKDRTMRVLVMNDLDLNFRDKYFGTHNVFSGEVTEDRRTLGVFNNSYLSDRLTMGYLAWDRAMDAWSCQAADVIGTCGSVARPMRLRDFDARSTEMFDHPSMVAGFDVTIGAGGTEAIHGAFGCVRQRSEFGEAGREYLEAEGFEKALKQVRMGIEARYAGVGVETPDDEFDRFVNVWIKHQLAYCVDWNRGWGKGFRDGMQDAWAWSAMDGGQVRRMIGDALPHQFADGRTLRKWAPVDAKPYNDGGIWLIFAVDAYLRETGDWGFLSEKYGYYQSEETGDVMDHMWRAVKHLVDERGERGLCKMPFGDWNDQLTGPGKGGKGESVWTTLALAGALPVVGEIARRKGDESGAEQCDAWRGELVEVLQKHGWNGRWFNRAITDEGKAIGHWECEAGQIFLLPQAWAMLADVASGEQREKMIEACDERLGVAHGYLLLGPPYRKFDPSVGHLSGANVGTVENGSNYCHATQFMVAAMAHVGWVDRAYETWKKVLPVNPRNMPSVTRQEPFSLTNTYRGPDAGASAGRSLFSWRTGTAGWAMRNALEGIMGVRAEHEGLWVRGTLPGGWDRAKMQRMYRGMKLRIEWKRTGRRRVMVDGRQCAGGLVLIEMMRDGAVIECEME